MEEEGKEMVGEERNGRVRGKEEGENGLRILGQWKRGTNEEEEEWRILKGIFGAGELKEAKFELQNNTEGKFREESCEEDDEGERSMTLCHVEYSWSFFFIDFVCLF